MDEPLTENERRIRRAEAGVLIRSAIADQMHRRKAFDLTPEDMLWLRSMNIGDPHNAQETAA